MKYITKEAAYSKLKNCRVFAKNRGIELQEFFESVGITGDVVGPFVIVNEGNVVCVGVDEFYNTKITEYEVNDILNHAVRQPIQPVKGKVYVAIDEYADPGVTRCLTCAGVDNGKLLTRVYINRAGEVSVNPSGLTYWPLDKIREATEDEAKLFERQLRNYGISLEGNLLRKSVYYTIRYNGEINSMCVVQMHDCRDASANWDFQHGNYFLNEIEAVAACKQLSQS